MTTHHTAMAGLPHPAIEFLSADAIAVRAGWRLRSGLQMHVGVLLIVQTSARALPAESIL